MPKKKETKEVKEEKTEKTSESATSESAIVKFSNVTVKLTAVDKVVWMEVLD